MRKILNRNYALIILLLIGLTAFSQTPQADKNYTEVKTFDDNGNAISESKVYSDKLGRQEQTQAKDYENSNVIITQVVFDQFGRPALQSLPAPAYITTTNNFLDGFMKSSNTGLTFNHDDYDKTNSTSVGSIMNPAAVQNTVKGSLGWYYSENNNEELYVSSSAYPYVRTVYDNDIRSRVVRVALAGDELKMGTDRQKTTYSNSVWELTELDEEGLGTYKSFDAEGRLVFQKNIVGNCTTNCFPIDRYYTLNYLGEQSVDIKLAASSKLYLTETHPSSNCTTVVPDVLFTFLDLEQGKTMVEGTDYSINTTTKEVSFLGDYANTTRRINIAMSYLQTWHDCAGYVGVTHEDQKIHVVSYMSEERSGYEYDSKGNLVRMIPPEAYATYTNPTVFQPYSQYNIKRYKLYGNIVKLSDGSEDWQNNYVTSDDFFESNVFDLGNNDDENSSYGFDINAVLRLNPEPEGEPECDFDTNKPPVLPGGLVSGQGTAVEQAEVQPGDFDSYQYTRYATEINQYSRNHVPEIDIEEEGEIDYVEQVNTFFSENEGTLNANSFSNFLEWGEDLNYSSGVDNVFDLARRNTGGILDADPPNDKFDFLEHDLPEYCLKKEIHCIDRVQNCGETSVDGGNVCQGFIHPCTNEPILNRGTFKITVKSQVRNKNTGIWHDVDAFVANPNDLIFQRSNSFTFLVDLNYNCLCQHSLNLVNSSDYAGGLLDQSMLEGYDKFRIQVVDRKWSPNTNSIRVYSSINPNSPNDPYQYMANYIGFHTTGTFARNPKRTRDQQVDLSKVVRYEYNFKNQVTKEISPDKGTTEYFYDDLHRLKFVQTAQQAVDNKFTYIDYDKSGRIIERGVLLSATEPNDVLNALVSTSSYTLEERHYVEYDQEGTGFPTSLSAYKHKYLKGKVSKTSNEESSTWFGYDQRGRLIWTVQKIADLAKSYTVNYTYNAQGNLATLDFQKEQASERFVHHYTYDANNRLKTVSTSTDGSTTMLNATYHYYQHGPLKRVELGTQLQGIDYVYTINGRLKSINNPVLGTRDPGKDGQAGSTHASFAEDIFGMTLDYFRGDYNREGTEIQTYSETSYDFMTQQITIHPSQYNGNIQAIRWRTRSETNAATPEREGKQLLFMPKYDARNRLIASAFGYINTSGNGVQNTNGHVWEIGTYDGPSPIAVNDYKVWDITYDKNGNLTQLKRNGNATSGLNMDNLTFNRSGNKLTQVIDAHTATAYGEDIEPQASNNYTYDVSGRLIGDVKESNYLTYNSDNLPTTIFKNGTKTTKKGAYFYDERGKRVSKEKYNSSGALLSTQYYIRDVSGNLMAVVQKQSGQADQIEMQVYGSAQLGTYNANASEYTYQLTDHLGNVRATIAGTKTANDASLLSMQDYYPFGSKMPGRSITTSTFYRLGYQGQPEDEETGFNNFELRLYDARIGGWLSPDPYNQHFSPYMAMSNNPLSFIDPDGGWDGNGDDPEGVKAYNSYTAATDALWNLCPTCTSGEIFEMYSSLQKTGIINPEIMFDIGTDLTYEGSERGPTEWGPWVVDATGGFRTGIPTWNHYYSSRPNTRGIYLESSNWTLEGFFDGVAQGLPNAIDAIGKKVTQDVNDIADGEFDKVLRSYSPLQPCNGCKTGLNLPTVENSNQAGQLASGMLFAIVVRKKPKLTRHGNLTDGVYTVSMEAMKKHIYAGVHGKSLFYPSIDPHAAVLKAAKYADEFGLWVGNKAKVRVLNGNIGVLGNGSPTNVINVYRKQNGIIHGSPGN